MRRLGPTADDLTAQAAAEAFDQPLTLFPDWLATTGRGATPARAAPWLPEQR